MGSIFFLSSRPSPEELKLVPIIARLKLVHIIEYGILYLLVYYAVLRTTYFTGWKAFVFSLAITVLYGMTDEFHQLYVPERTCRFADVVADGVGGIFAQGVLLALRKRTN